MMNQNIIFILLIIFLAGCFKKTAHLDEDLSPRYEKAINYFNKAKYGRAKDEFDYIIMYDPGSKLANESQYYMAESMFQLEEFIEASTT